VSLAFAQSVASPPGGTKWSDAETETLRNLTQKHPIPRKPSRSYWNGLAELMGAAGYPRRSADSLCHRALAVKLYEPSRITRSRVVAAEARVVAQVSFDSIAAAKLVAQALRIAADVLEGKR